MLEGRTRLEKLLSVRRMPTSEVVRFLQDEGLLLNARICPGCGLPMNLKGRQNVIDGVCWVCNNSLCPSSLNRLSIRHGSFFEGMRLSLSDVFTVIILWSEGMQIKDVVSHYGITRLSVMKIYHRLRGMVLRDLEEDPIRLGGRGVICQIDETLLVHKSKNHVGRQPSEQIWAFGIVDTSFSPAKGYVEIVPDRSRDTLLPIIARVCKPGSVIHSDGWAAYRDIQNRLGFSHENVNHKYNFVDPATGVHTQHIESYWNRLKNRTKAMKGVTKDELPFIVAEFVWKDNKRELAFSHLMGLCY